MCRQALKGLDLMNIKLLPERYILKRWTRDARSGIVQDMHGKDIMENPKLDVALRYKNLCKMFISLASRAADFEDCYLLVEDALHSVSKQVNEKKSKELLPLMLKSLVFKKHSACLNNMRMLLV